MTTLPQTLEEIKAQFAATLNGRCERAAKIALSGAVSQVDDCTWHVKSQTSDVVYAVTFKLSWACTCRDFIGDGYAPAPPTVEFFGGTGAACKHVLAVGACWVSGTYPAPPSYDLVIATKRAPFVSGPDGKILWWKKANEPKVEASKDAYLTDGPILAALLKYELVHTECRQGQVIRRYRLAGGAL